MLLKWRLCWLHISITRISLLKFCVFKYVECFTFFVDSYIKIPLLFKYSANNAFFLIRDLRALDLFKNWLVDVHQRDDWNRRSIFHVLYHFRMWTVMTLQSYLSFIDSHPLLASVLPFICRSPLGRLILVSFCFFCLQYNFYVVNSQKTYYLITRATTCFFKFPRTKDIFFCQFALNLVTHMLRKRYFQNISVEPHYLCLKTILHLWRQYPEPAVLSEEWYHEAIICLEFGRHLLVHQCVFLCLW